MTYTLECVGPGGTTTRTQSVSVSPPPAGSVVINGEITFDRVPFRTLPQRGLNPSSPVVSKVREVLVEALDGGNRSVLASSTTDLNGRYAVVVPASRSVMVTAKAQMLKTGAAPSWNFRVLNNTNADALYVLEDTAENSGTVNSQRNLHAASGWGLAGYTGTRAAAPFAILDTVYRAKELILTASPSAVFPALDLFWSINNRPAAPFCPDDGNIVTSLYTVFGPPPFNVDDCNRPGASGIYILGNFAAGDTDEFDQHVIAHEFGHYIEDKFSRTDSIGGSHSIGQRVDLRLAFGEGWGNAYSAMALNDPEYRDSSNGVTQDTGFNLETDDSVNEGWFSESSVGEILWDIFDGGTEPGDTVALGFGPIFSVMTGAQVSTDAVTSIFPFAAALRSANSSSAAAIGTLLSRESISGTDAFGSGESNDGGDTRALPVYRTITRNNPLTGVCSSSVAGSGDLNKLGNRRFLRFDNDATRLVTIRADGAVDGAGTTAATDPDIFVYRRGALVALGTSVANGTEVIPQFSLPAGTYVIEVYDDDLTGTNQPPRCMTVSITG